MGWRAVVIDSRCKIAYKSGYIILRKEEEVLVHVSEIDLLLVATTQASFTCVAIAELIKNKVKIIFCDEKHEPLGELTAYYGCHNTSKKILKQINWAQIDKSYVADRIIIQKILNQAKVLKLNGKEIESQMLVQYSKEVYDGDVTNREGHAAKVYFNALFGTGFSRENSYSPINAALNYGYTVFLSYINREVVSNGCLTQLGVKHKNEFNQFNLSCDIIEPFRPIVDDFVVRNSARQFDKEYKYDLVKLLSQKVRFCDKSVYLSTAISQSVKSIIDGLDNSNVEKIKLYEF